MKKFSLLLVSLLMQVAVVNTAYAQESSKPHEYSFDESYGVRSALTYLPNGLTGKGVLVGIIDNGIDFNHINFLDPKTFQTRVKFACSIKEGKEYCEARTPEAIKELLPYNYTDHGTHVTGIAAGSYAADGWHGIATDANLLLADVDAGDDAIIQSLKKIFAAADLLDMPLVVNISLAQTADLHRFEDGNHAHNLLCEELTANGTKQGRIIVVSSNNWGHVARTYSDATIGAEGKVRFVLKQDMADFDGNSLLGLSFNAQKQANLDLRFFLYDTINKKEVTMGVSDRAGAPVDFSSVAKNSMFTDESHQDEESLDYDLVLDVYNFAKNIVPCIEISGAKGTEIRYIQNVISIDDDYFTPLHLIHDGNPSRLAMTPAVISVGNLDAHIGQIRKNSSFGVNKEGGKIPDVVAAGSGIISSGRSIKSFDPDGEKHLYDQREVAMADGSTQTFQWLSLSGTSQAAPLVSGLVALMLEYDKTLTTERVRELLHSTNDWTDACDKAPMGPDQAGHGILNTKALFEKLMGETSIKEVSASPADNAIYDLFGRRLSDIPAQGIYIRNGKKVVRK